MTAASTYSLAGTLNPPCHGPDEMMADDVVRVMRADGSLSDDLGINDEQALDLYRAMVRTRIVDDRAVSLQRQGRIGFHIGSLGEEATVVGSAFGMRDQDWLFPCYREFGAALMRGLSLEQYFGNLYGNANDIAKGRQMPDHWCSRAHHLTSVSSPIGTQITQAVGFAWAAKIQKDPLAVLVYFGDGATSSAEFHNGLNFAGVFKVPTVFLCRNNGWAISVPTDRQTASESFAIKGIAYGIPGVRCDGNDVFAVIKTTQEAVARAAAGKGPTLIEALTYRLAGHSTSDDPGRYRPSEQVDPWQALDPNSRMRKHLETRLGWSEDDQQALETEVSDEVKQAVELAENAPPPALESMFDDVFCDLPWHLDQQREELLAGPRAKGHGS